MVKHTVLIHTACLTSEVKKCILTKTNKGYEMKKTMLLTLLCAGVLFMTGCEEKSPTQTTDKEMKCQAGKCASGKCNQGK